MTWKDWMKNITLLERTSSTDLYTLLCLCHLCLAGHVYRIEDSHFPKAIIYGEIKNAPRPRRRTRLLQSCTRRDLTAFGIASWDSCTSNRSKRHYLIQSGKRMSVQLCKDCMWQQANVCIINLNLLQCCIICPL